MNVTTSLWDTEFLEYDVAIVGAGIIGVNTAISLKQKNPHLRIVVVERNIVPHGASTRNAGFACFGSASEIAADIDQLGPDVTFDLVYRRVTGLQLLLNRVKNYDVGFENHGGYEVLLEGFPKIATSMLTTAPAVLNRLDEINTLLLPIFSAPAFHSIPDQLTHHNFSLHAKHLLYTPFESTIHSGKLMHALWHLAQELGVDVRTGYEVSDIQAQTVAGIPEITLLANMKPPVKCRQIVVAASAQIPMLTRAFADLEIVPARGQIIVTSPIPNLAINGSYHMDGGYYYFRNVGNRVLLGGGRNTDLKSEETYSMDTTEQIQQLLEELLRTVILPKCIYTIEQRWAGTMAFSQSKQPIVKTVAPGITVAFGCNGMGVAIGSSVAEQAAALVA